MRTTSSPFTKRNPATRSPRRLWRRSLLSNVVARTDGSRCFESDAPSAAKLARRDRCASFMYGPGIQARPESVRGEDAVFPLLHRDAALAAPRSLPNRRLLPQQSQLLRTWRRSLPTALFRPQRPGACLGTSSPAPCQAFGARDDRLSIRIDHVRLGDPAGSRDSRFTHLHLLEERQITAAVPAGPHLGQQQVEQRGPDTQAAQCRTEVHLAQLADRFGGAGAREPAET